MKTWEWPQRVSGFARQEYSCNDGVPVDDLVPLPNDVRESCNLTDDDCDGLTDERLNCGFACELYREANVCCNIWFDDEAAALGGGENVCSGANESHPCCDPSVQNYTAMYEARPHGAADPVARGFNPCCDEQYPWPNFEPLFSKQTRFLSGLPLGENDPEEFAQTCIGSRQGGDLPPELQNYVDANSWNASRVEKDLYEPVDNPCANGGVVNTWTWNAERQRHENGIGDACGLYVRFYDEDFYETGPRLDVRWQGLEDGLQTVTAAEDCLWGTRGFSYSQAADCGRHFDGLDELEGNENNGGLGCDSIWAETPAYYQYLMPIPEAATGYTQVQFDVTDADGAMFNQQLNAVAFDNAKRLEDIECVVQSNVEGVPTFTGDSRPNARCWVGRATG